MIAPATTLPPDRRGCGDDLDAAVLLLPLVGFLAAGEKRMARSIDAIDAELSDGGLHRRLERRDDEGVFLPVTFWLAA